jgi:hypothetical protein
MQIRITGIACSINPSFLYAFTFIILPLKNSLIYI